MGVVFHFYNSDDDDDDEFGEKTTTRPSKKAQKLSEYANSSICSFLKLQSLS